MLRALIWDVDGTLAETERDGHRIAFNLAFEHLGLPWRWSVERYGELLAITGGRERLLHDLGPRPELAGDPDQLHRLAVELHALKNRYYAELVSGGSIELRPGVRELFDDCAAAGVAMAIATTTSEANIGALLEPRLGAQWRRRFVAVIGAETAPRKKPDPLAYRIACAALGRSASECLAVEDSRNGVDAAHAAGLAVLVTRSVYFAAQRFDDAMAACDSLAPPTGLVLHGNLGVAQGSGRIGLEQLCGWHERFVAGSAGGAAGERDGVDAAAPGG